MLYQKAYYMLFHAITDTIQLLEQRGHEFYTVPIVIEKLKQAQQDTEELYISSEE